MVDVVDIDQDGDKDYLYMMDSVLYVKYNHTKEPSVQKDTTLNIDDLDPNLIPEAPNFFHEVVSSPREINLDFSPARVNDRGYRLEFFDHYTEWDLTHIGIHDEKAIPRSFVDILLDDPLADQTVGGIRTHRLDRVLESVNESDGFSIE